MHINDVYALKSVLAAVANGRPVDDRVLAALREAVDDHIEGWLEDLERRAAAEEAQRDFIW